MPGSGIPVLRGCAVGLRLTGSVADVRALIGRETARLMACLTRTVLARVRPGTVRVGAERLIRRTAGMFLADLGVLLARWISGGLVRNGGLRSRLLLPRILLCGTIPESRPGRSRCGSALRRSRCSVSERPSRGSGPALIRGRCLLARTGSLAGRIRPRVELRGVGRLRLVPRQMPGWHRHIHGPVPTAVRLTPARLIGCRGCTRIA